VANKVGSADDSKPPARVGTQHKSTQPADVGIARFLNDKPGFSAIIKQRYEDFHVTEVGAAGAVAHLTEPLKPQDKKRRGRGSTGDEKPNKKKIFIDQNWSEYLTGNVAHVRQDLAIAEIAKLLGDQDAKRVREFVNDPSALTLVLSPCETKSTRSRMHAIFRESFYGFVTDTIPYSEDGSTVAAEKPSGGQKLTCIRVRRNSRSSRKQVAKQQKNGKRPRFDDRGTQKQWSGGGKEYVQFILWKENMDTNRMLSQVRLEFG